MKNQFTETYNQNGVKYISSVTNNQKYKYFSCRQSMKSSCILSFLCYYAFLSHGNIPNCFWANKVSLFKHATTRLTFTLKLIYDHCDTRWNVLSGCLFSGHITKKHQYYLTFEVDLSFIVKTSLPFKSSMLAFYAKIVDNFWGLAMTIWKFANLILKEIIIRVFRFFHNMSRCHE